jgi:hypothetical protein
MSRTDRYTVQFVESFPTPMETGVLYVSTTYSTSGHICPCGCGLEVVTKLSPARWRVSFDGEVSLSPSVAATGLPCNSHYFITRGHVDWHGDLDQRQAALVREADRRAVEEHRLLTSRRGRVGRLWRRSRRNEKRHAGRSGLHTES